jgi:hypothetical protein
LWILSVLHHKFHVTLITYSVNLFVFGGFSAKSYFRHLLGFWPWGCSSSNGGRREIVPAWQSNPAPPCPCRTNAQLHRSYTRPTSWSPTPRLFLRWGTCCPIKLLVFSLPFVYSHWQNSQIITLIFVLGIFFPFQYLCGWINSSTKLSSNS